jgi:sulfur-oxidizing protein SoxX
MRLEPTGKRVVAIASLAAALMLAAVGAAAEDDYRVAGDAIPQRLGGSVGDAVRGRAIVLDRRTGNCLICHRVPEPGELFQGDLGPDLDGVGARLSEGQIRLRVVDVRRLNPAALMPSYHRTVGLRRVALEFAGKPVLTAAQIEDVVAWLVTLK